MGRLARKKGKTGPCQGYGRRGGKTRTKTKDLDEIIANLKNKDELLKSLPLDLDQIGNGQHYCVECARYFQDKDVLLKHEKSKSHKRRLKKLNEDGWQDL